MELFSRLLPASHPDQIVGLGLVQPTPLDLGLDHFQGGSEETLHIGIVVGKGENHGVGHARGQGKAVDIDGLGLGVIPQVGQDAAHRPVGIALRPFVEEPGDRLVVTIDRVDELQQDVGQDVLGVEFLYTLEGFAGSLPSRVQALIRARDQGERLESNEATRTLAMLLAEDNRFSEAWYQVAMLRWADNPYRGADMAEAREAFERVKELDPQNILPDVLLKFVYAIDGDYEAIAGLFDEWTEGNPNRAMRGILAYLRDDPEAQAVYVDSLPLASLSVAHAMILTFPDNNPNVERFLAAALEVVEPEIQRGWLYETQAHNLIGMGRWEEAREQFHRMTDRLRAWRLVYESIAMALPFNAATDEELDSQISRLRSWRANAEPYLIDPAAKGLIESRYSPDSELHPHMKAYVLGLLQVRLGDLEAAKRELSILRSLEIPAGQEVICREYVRTVQAWIQYAEAGPESALALLEDACPSYLPSQGYSGVQERGPQRWLRARCLEEVGRGEEALGWYGSLHEKTERQLIYVADARLHRASILEELGRDDEARDEYQSFLDLYADADSRYRDAVASARAGLARIPTISP